MSEINLLPTTDQASSTTSFDTTSTPKRHRVNPWLVGVILALVFGAALGAIGSYFYIAAQKEEMPENSQAVTPSKTAAPTSTPSATPQPTTDTYVGWHEYSSPTKAYSFRYPATWKLAETTEKHPFVDDDKTNYENITLTRNGQEVVNISYPFELIGCDQTKDKVYIFGEKPVILTADCETDIYLGIFKSPYALASSDANKQWPNLVVKYNYTTANDQDFTLFAKSFTGIQPAK